VVTFVTTTVAVTIAVDTMVIPYLFDIMRIAVTVITTITSMLIGYILDVVSTAVAAVLLVLAS